MKEYPETHQHGYISVENPEMAKIAHGDFGIQIAKDGRVWICINGVAFLRFKPEGLVLPSKPKDLNIDGTCPVCGSDNTELVPSVGGYDAKCNVCDWTGNGDDYKEAGN